MNKFRKMVNTIYEYIDAGDPEDVKKQLDSVVDFVIRLRHSYVDNDKPVSTIDVNMEILRIADLEGLRTSKVRIGNKDVDLRER